MKRRSREYPAERAIYMRVRYLPRQLEAARKKVAMLENEARRYGMHDLLQQKDNPQ